MRLVPWLTGLVLSLAALALAQPPPGGWPPPPTESTVASVHDGDTVTLATGDKIRLRWVNTPEIHPLEQYGPEARAATEAFVLHRSVRLLVDHDKERDGYGRILAGIQTDEGNLSLHLLELGLGHLFLIPPDDTDLAPFFAAEAKAKAVKRGIWSSERYQGALHITSFHANGPGDDRADVNGEYLRVCNITLEPLDTNGFRIGQASGKSFPIPAVVVPPGATFELHSGVGENQTSPSLQIALFLGQADPIWNNDGDRATIYDRFGKVVDAREYHVEHPDGAR
jgi:micrococcal nuclease